MPASVDVHCVCKDGLFLELQEILKDDDFCGQVPPESERLNVLLDNFEDNIWFAIEFPYVDRHYRDTYYTFHSAKFKKTGRNCIRVHIFRGEVTKSDILLKNARINKKYLGFFIIRPLLYRILGRSLISPKAFKEKKFVCCLMKTRVSLLGNEFTVHGFPHIVQDTETHTCAESSLWSFIEYYGSKYPQYKPLLPSQIVKTLLDNAEHRILPSVGLTENELPKCLQTNGFQCHVYSLNNSSKIIYLSRMMQIYIESGMPLLLLLENANDGHAVLAIGHKEDASIYKDTKKLHWLKDNAWVDISSLNKKLVFIDDNMPPYNMADISQPTLLYQRDDRRNMAVKYFFAPLPVHMFLAAEKAYDLIKKIFNDEQIGLEKLGEKWITRLLLTGSRSYKRFIYNNGNKSIDDSKILLLHLAMPRFIWICEVYKKDEFKKNGQCSGLVIIDATSDGKSLASVLWYAVENRLFLHNNVSWNKNGFNLKVPFRMSTYKHNLKGAWNGWES